MKRGNIAFDHLGKIIILIVSLFILIGVVYTIYVRLSTSAYDKSACQLSVVFNSKSRMPLTHAELWPTDCPTRYVRFTKTGYVEESGRLKNTVDFRRGITRINIDSCKARGMVYDDCLYLEEVNKVIALRIFDCWEQFMAGQLLVFNNYDKDRQCNICAVIEFDNDVRDKFGEVYSQYILPPEKTLDEYMRTQGPLGREITYYEYTRHPLSHFREEYYDYNFGKSYAVVFTAMNSHYVEQVLKFRIIDWLKGHNNERFVNTLHFIEQQEISQRCDVLAG
jgi:hypothetical protein